MFTFLSLYSPLHNQLSSSVSQFYSKLKVLRYRRSGGRTELSDHQNTGNFEENPNSMVPRAGLGGFEKSNNGGFFRARSAPLTYVLQGQTKSNFCRARSAPLTFVLKIQHKKNVFFRARSAPFTLNWLKKRSSGNCF